MSESPRVKAILDSLISGEQTSVEEILYGPFQDSARSILTYLRSLSEKSLVGTFGQEKLLTLLEGLKRNSTITIVKQTPIISKEMSSYKIGMVRASNFRGLQVFNGPVFEYNFEGHTQLISGTNGTGKSSILNAIVWAFTGKLLWDRSEPSEAPGISIINQDNIDLNTIHTSWPSEVALPSAENFTQKNKEDFKCWVEIELIPESSDKGPQYIKRILLNPNKSKVEGFQEFDPLSIELSLLMPAKVSHIQFTTDSQLGDIFINVSGLEKFNMLGIYAKEMQKPTVRLINEKNSLKKSLIEKNKTLAESIRTCIPTELMEEYSKIGKTGSQYEKIQQKHDWLFTKAKDRLSELQSKIGELPTDFEDKIQILSDRIVTAFETISLSSPDKWKSVKTMQLSLINYKKEEIDTFTKEILTTTEQLIVALEWHSKKQQIKKLELILKAAELISSESDSESCPLCEQKMLASNPVRQQLEEYKGLDEAATLSLVEVITKCCQKLDKLAPNYLHNMFSENLMDVFNNEFDLNIGKYLNGGLLAFKEKIYSTASSSVQSFLQENLTLDLTVYKVESLDQVQYSDLLKPYILLANMYIDKMRNLSWAVSYFSTYKTTLFKVFGFEENSSSDTLVSILKSCKLIIQSSKPIQNACTQMTEYLNNLKQINVLTNEVNEIDSIKSGLMELEILKDLADQTLASDLTVIKGRIQEIYELLYGSNEFPLSLIKSTRTGRHIDFNFLVKHRGLLIEASPLINASRIRAILWAYIFAMSEIRRKSSIGNWLDFSLLDDPLTSFDEGHRTRFARMIFNENETKQYIVSSHDIEWPRHIKQHGLNIRVQRVKSLSTARDVINITEWRNIVETDMKSWSEDKKDEQLAKRFVDSVRIWLEEELKDILVYCPISPRVDDNLDGLLKKLNDGILNTTFYKSNLYRELNTEIKELSKDIHNSHHGGELRSRIYSDEADLIRKKYGKISAVLERCWDDYMSKLYTISKVDSNSILS